MLFLCDLRSFFLHALAQAAVRCKLLTSLEPAFLHFTLRFFYSSNTNLLLFFPSNLYMAFWSEHLCRAPDAAVPLNRRPKHASATPLHCHLLPRICRIAFSTLDLRNLDVSSLHFSLDALRARPCFLRAPGVHLALRSSLDLCF